MAASAACGHGQPISNGRCWSCFLAHLRDTGQGARADRLIELKRQHDEGRLHLPTTEEVVDAIVEAYIASRTGPPGTNEYCPTGARYDTKAAW